ncbi:hypothetical protein ACJX0J_013414, partial [Zea mays]
MGTHYHHHMHIFCLFLISEIKTADIPDNFTIEVIDHWMYAVKYYRANPINNVTIKPLII